MKQDYLQDNEVCIVTYNDSIDWEFIQKNTIIDEKCIGSSKLIILNMEYVSFVDSIGIGELVRLNSRINCLKKHLCLIKLKPNLQKIFSLSELDCIFSIFKTETDARSFYLL